MKKFDPSAGKQNIKAYQNIMEILVQQEISRQVSRLPSNLAAYINPAEVATFALNRLPPLYASSEQGRDRQEKRGQQTLKQDIATAVRQAIAAVQRDPIRASTPLPSMHDPRYSDAETALKDIENMLRDGFLIGPEDLPLTWDNVVLVLIRALKKTAERGIVDRRLDQILQEWEYDRYTPPLYDWVDRAK